MAENTIYLRPSADISVEHSFYPADSTEGYLLINDEVSDNDSTYLSSTTSPNADTTVSATSSFLMNGTIPNDAFNIIGARVVCSIYASQYCLNETVSFTTSINGTQYGTASLDSNTITNAGMVEINGKVYNDYSLELSSEIVDALNNYINGNTLNMPEVSLSVASSYTGGSKGEGYLRISQVYIELDYDIGVHRKVNNSWKSAIVAYKKINGIWSKFDNSRSTLSAGLARFGHEQIEMPFVDYTCTENGLTQGYKCSICGEAIRPQKVLPAAHRPTADYAINATCVATGLTKGFHCSMCEEILVTQEVIPINPDNHTNIVTDAAKAATCAATGLTQGEHCDDCNKVLVAQQIIPATGEHTYVILDNSEECSVCGHVLRRFGLAYHSAPTSLSEARNYLAATTVGNYALFGGGTTSAVDAYDASLTRTTPTALSEGRSSLAATTVGNYALFGGGYKGGYEDLATVDAYDTSLTRTTPATLSESRYLLAATTIGNYALFGGGKINGQSYDTVDAYDTSLTRTTSTALSKARSSLAATSVGNYALFGGLQTVDAYDTSLTRTTPATLSVNSSSLAATTINNYALFGGGSGTYYSSTVDAYDTSLTRTTLTALSEARGMLAATTVGNYALFGGGYTGTNEVSTVDAYDASLTRTTQTALSIRRSSLAATTIGNYALFGGGGNTSVVDAYINYDMQ